MQQKKSFAFGDSSYDEKASPQIARSRVFLDIHKNQAFWIVSNY